jgi:hypothetical protein
MTTKKNKFSLKRVALLLQRYFLENMNQEIMFWLIITIILTIFDHRNFVIIILFISGLISSVRLQKELLRGPNGMHYLLIPATHAEKVTATVILNTIYHFAMILLAYTIGNLLATLIYHLILKIQVPLNWDLFQVTTITFIDGIPQPTIQSVFWSLFGFFAFSQAIFMLGTLYFDKNALPKTIFSLIGLGFFLFLIQVILFKSIWEVKYLSNAIIPAMLMISDSTMPTYIKTIIDYGSYLLLPFLWIVSYFRLTEKQV